MKYYNTLIENIPVTIELIRTPFLELGRKMIKETERIIPESKITDITYLCDYCNEEFAFKENLDEHQTINRLKYLGNSGYDFGYNQIWDCGQAKYILE